MQVHAEWADVNRGSGVVNVPAGWQGQPNFEPGHWVRGVACA
ncbi:YXWGXW repeat-containing protein [Acidovorax facilis]|uniref:YXWGXW repeat-containing protein n=1 Tax=Acidovorax facilis TaxID=12917 RepID=A0ABV8D6P0_9BURK|nr:YXWGXW repeat-containing protein [Acidovorax sp. SD340]MBV7461905.1 YXWGXW repeat-containing protein [Acidovorax sp. sif0632]MBV7466721.1 YXWGXW repeat-containing protein [Acidovorax sp. sif0613]